MQDYKQKYEQAMLRMNKWVEGSEITDPKEVSEFVFPELKESEDEKISKELISYLSDIIDNICSEEDIPHDAKILGGKIRHWIAWLEKQKDHEDELERAYKCADEVQYRKGYEAAKREFEKQGEQKPAWSEKDEKMFNSIIEVLEVTPSARFIPIKREIMIPWLKLLKERIKEE